MPKNKKAAVRDGGGVLGRLGTDGRGGTEEFCPEFGLGWKRIGTKKSKGDKKGILDYHYVSPGGHKFKSKPVVFTTQPSLRRLKGCTHVGCPVCILPCSMSSQTKKMKRL